MNNLTIIYYTSNRLDKVNPYFLRKTREQLLRAVGDFPIVIVSQKPMIFGKNSINVNMGDIGRSHLNIYRQILEGCKAATTEFVAMAEDDILYSYEHFHSELPVGDVFLYDMNKVSLFTWIKPPLFSFRHDRMVVNQLIAPRLMLIEALEERFERVKYLIEKADQREEKVIRLFGDPGRYERQLGVTERRTDTFMCTCPSIVYSHEEAFGFLNQGKKKRLGDLRILEVQGWPRADELVKWFYEYYER